jgi:hypothetical protein
MNIVALLLYFSNVCVVKHSRKAFFIQDSIDPLLSLYLLLYMAEVASTGTKLLEWK